LSSLRNVVGNTFDDFLTLGDALRLRGCGRALAAQYSPSAAPQLWQRIRPPFSEFNRIAGDMRASGAAFFEQLYNGAAKSTFRNHIGTIGCTSGNLDLVRWFYSGPVPVTSLLRPERCLAAACKFGQPRIAAWVAAEFNLEPECLHQTFGDEALLSIACNAGNIAMATWLIQFGYEPKARENGYRLLTRARANDDVSIAAWVLATFPLAMASDDVCALVLEDCASAPRCVRFLIEHFDLPWDDVSEVYTRLLTSLDRGAGADRAACHSVRRWLVVRYGSAECQSARQRLMG
jgi:hypothetical protein